MTDQQPETTEDQRPAEAPEQHAERPGYGVTRKFPKPETTDEQLDLELEQEDNE